MTHGPVGPAIRALQAEEGAVFGEIAGEEVALRYPDADEYAAATGASAVARRNDRAQIRLWGKDPVRMVQGLISNDLSGAPAGRAVYAVVLTPKGRTLAEVRAVRLSGESGTEVVLDLPREALEGLRGHLTRFVPPLFARWSDVSEEMSALGVYGPGAHEAVGAVLGPAPELLEDDLAQVGWRGRRLLLLGSREHGVPGIDILGAGEDAADLWRSMRSAGATPLGRETLETLRIEAGRPRYGAELSEASIPTEAFESTGLIPRAISFTKGCYTGQEVIVRIAHRGHVNRHLRGLTLGEAPAPEPGTALWNPESGKEMGRVTSATRSPRMGQAVALGYVRREVEPGATLRLGGPEGAPTLVHALPFGRAAG